MPSLPVLVLAGSGLVIALTAGYMYRRGKVDDSKLSRYQHLPESVFRGISTPQLSLPEELRKEALAFLDATAADPSVARRVDVPGIRAGKTVACKTIIQCIPSLIRWYEGEGREAVSRVVGSAVYPTPLHLPTSCCILVYDRPADGIEWHYDVNYFTGKFFTTLVPISLNCSHSLYHYRDAHGRDVGVDLQSPDHPGRAVVFEGDVVFHKASKLAAGEYRAVLSLQYSTDPSLTWLNRLLMFIKDRAFVGSDYF